MKVWFASLHPQQPRGIRHKWIKTCLTSYWKLIHYCCLFIQAPILHKRPSHTHIHLSSCSKSFCTCVMLGIPALQVVVGSQIKEYLTPGPNKEARNTSWRLLRGEKWEDKEICLSGGYQWEQEGLLVASGTFQQKHHFLHPSQNFDISTAQEWLLFFGWTMVVPWVVPQHRFIPCLACPNWNGGSQDSQRDESKARRDLLFTHTRLKGQGFNSLSILGWCSLGGRMVFFIVCNDNISTPISTPFSIDLAVKVKTPSALLQCTPTPEQVLYFHIRKRV